jgi:hypothetical protein
MEVVDEAFLTLQEDVHTRKSAGILNLPAMSHSAPLNPVKQTQWGEQSASFTKHSSTITPVVSFRYTHSPFSKQVAEHS